MTADYGQAIRVLHHGCEEAVEYAGLDVHTPGLREMAMGIAFGYALALQVMTGRPAIEHIERALRVVGERHEQSIEEDGPEILSALPVLLEAIGVPHERWEEKRAKETR